MSLEIFHSFVFFNQIKSESSPHSPSLGLPHPQSDTRITIMYQSRRTSRGVWAQGSFQIHGSADSVLHLRQDPQVLWQTEVRTPRDQLHGDCGTPSLLTPATHGATSGLLLDPNPYLLLLFRWQEAGNLMLAPASCYQKGMPSFPVSPSKATQLTELTFSEFIDFSQLVFLPAKITKASNHQEPNCLEVNGNREQCTK